MAAKNRKKASGHDSQGEEEELMSPQGASAVEQMVAGFTEMLKRQEEDRQRSMEKEEARLRREELRWKEEEEARRQLEEKLERERLELQFKMEERRMRHEKEMKEMYYEYEKSKQAREDKRKLADKVAKWEDADQPEAYLQRFEESMKEAGIPENEWPQQLRPLLSGKALAAYHKDVPEDARMNYQQCKGPEHCWMH